ncbi:hypothetical protein V2J09_015940 [Rumex salicifolius]
MASASSIVPSLSPGLRRHHCSSRPLLPPFFPLTINRSCSGRRSCSWRGRPRAMVQESVPQGPSATYAREMERLSAKESLLLAFKDAGGFESLVTGKTTDVQRVDVAERITSLERLNPTPRPTTSPFLEGKWSLDWFAAKPSGLFATSLIFQRLSTTFINLSKVDILIKDGYTKVTASIKLLNSVEAKLMLSSKLSVEGPVRMKEESVDCLLEPPSLIEQAVPEQLRSAMGQASDAVQQLPVPIRDAFSSGVTVPLSGTITRLFMISYLDDEILIIRDTDGLAEVLTRLNVPTPACNTSQVCSQHK